MNLSSFVTCLANEYQSESALDPITGIEWYVLKFKDSVLMKCTPPTTPAANITNIAILKITFCLPLLLK